MTENLHFGGIMKYSVFSLIGVWVFATIYLSTHVSARTLSTTGNAFKRAQACQVDPASEVSQAKWSQAAIWDHERSKDRDRLEAKEVYLSKLNRRALYDGIADIVPGKQMFCRPVYEGTNHVRSMKIDHYHGRANFYFDWASGSTIYNPLDWGRLLLSESLGFFNDFSCKMDNGTLGCGFGKNIIHAAVGKNSSIKLDLNRAVVVYEGEDVEVAKKRIPFWHIPAKLRVGLSFADFVCTQYATDFYAKIEMEYLSDLGSCSSL